MTFLKRLYLIFILFPCAILYASAVMIVTIIQHLIDQSKISKY
jgi:hypothetical protein